MNANVGMMYPVFAPFDTHTDGSMPTYGTGIVLHEARNATVTREYANNPFRGDDIILDDDNGMTGLTMTFEPTGLKDSDRVALFGDEANANTTTGGYWVSDNETPYGGFGYVRKMRDKDQKSFEAWWTLKIKFQEENQQTQTRDGQINWGTPTLNGRAAGVIVDNTEKERFQLHKTFETAAAAKAWLNTLANIAATT